jgi:hypothetical protein
MEEEKMTAILPINLPAIYTQQRSYESSLQVLQTEQATLEEVKIAINKQIKPTLPFRNLFRRNWKPLTALLENQVDIVRNISTTLEEITEQCAEDKTTLLDYATTLQERMYASEELSKELGKREEEITGTTLVDQLKQSIEQLEIRGQKQRNEQRQKHTQEYTLEMLQLVPLMIETYDTFSGAAETAKDWATNLQATGRSYAKLIALGQSSVQIKGILNTIEQNNNAVYGAVTAGVQKIQSLFTRLGTGNYRPRIQVVQR